MKEVWFKSAKSLEFCDINNFKTGFYGIMVIENLRSAVAPKEKSI